jgi:hypothetical protein
MNSTRLLRGPALAVAALLLIGSAAFASQMALGPKEDGLAGPTTEAGDLHSLLAAPSAAESEQGESADQSESAEPSDAAESESETGHQDASQPSSDASPEDQQEGDQHEDSASPSAEASPGDEHEDEQHDASASASPEDDHSGSDGTDD